MERLGAGLGRALCVGLGYGLGLDVAVPDGVGLSVGDGDVLAAGDAVVVSDGDVVPDGEAEAAVAAAYMALALFVKNAAASAELPGTELHAGVAVTACSAEARAARDGPKTPKAMMVNPAAARSA